MNAVKPAIAPGLSRANVFGTEHAKPTTIDGLIVYLAQTIPNETLISYPTRELGVSDFTDYMAKELDHFVDETAKDLANQGLQPMARIYEPLTVDLS